MKFLLLVVLCVFLDEKRLHFHGFIVSAHLCFMCLPGGAVSVN